MIILHNRWPLRGIRRAISRSFSSSATFPLKHVTRSNFEPVLSELRSHVRAADFVAIDLEMTGITSAPWRESFEFDRFDIRYLKVRDSAEKFAVLQFGVCPFRWDSLKQSFIAHPHNFFVFPREEIPNEGQPYEFLCQTSSMEFLAKYQFDFNACINEGISFLSKTQEVEALRRLKLRDSRSESKKMLKDEDHKKAEMQIEAAIGFRQVVDLLSSENKLIVGHNCFLDIAHIHSKFLGPLPPTAEEFVSSINDYLPQIVDTKLLLNTDSVLQQKMKKARTNLSSAFATFCPEIAYGSKNSSSPHEPCVKVEVQVDHKRSSNWNSRAKHEAGYDAFMTGCVFAQACSLGVEFSPWRNFTQNEKLQKHINLLYLNYINGVIIDLRTGKSIAETLSIKKKQPTIVFENIVLIWGFSSKLKCGEIRECITKVFGSRSVTSSVFPIDETAVFVQFSNRKLASDFLALKEVLEKNSDLVSELHPLAKLLEGGNTSVASYEAYKEICSSPITKLVFADQADTVCYKWKTRRYKNDEVTDSRNDAQNVRTAKGKNLIYAPVLSMKTHMSPCNFYSSI